MMRKSTSIRLNAVVLLMIGRNTIGSQNMIHMVKCNGTADSMKEGDVLMISVK